MKQKVTRWSNQTPDLHLALSSSLCEGVSGPSQTRPAVSAWREFRENCSLEVWNSRPGLFILFYCFIFEVFVELFNMQFVSFCRELLSETVTWLIAAPLYNPNCAFWVLIRKPHSAPVPLPAFPPPPGVKGETERELLQTPLTSNIFWNFGGGRGMLQFLKCIFISFWFDSSWVEDLLNASAEVAEISEHVTSPDVTVALSLIFL